MGPIELSFLIVIVLFGVVGIVRGYQRELGVTLMLLVALLVIQLLDDRFSGLFDRLLGFVAGTSAQAQTTTEAILYTLFLIVVVFISYQGVTFSFTGSGTSTGLSLGAGLLNGYLFAGSIWYYLARANWPFLDIREPFSDFYRAAVRVLPPNLLDWRYLLALVVVMLILRVWK